MEIKNIENLLMRLMESKFLALGRVEITRGHPIQNNSRTMLNRLEIGPKTLFEIQEHPESNYRCHSGPQWRLQRDSGNPVANQKINYFEAKSCPARPRSKGFVLKSTRCTCTIFISRRKRVFIFGKKKRLFMMILYVATFLYF